MSSRVIGPESPPVASAASRPEKINTGFYEMIACSEGMASVGVRMAEIWGESRDGIVNPAALVNLTAAWHSKSAVTASQAMMLSATEGTTGTCCTHLEPNTNARTGNAENMRPAVPIHACLA